MQRKIERAAAISRFGSSFSSSSCSRSRTRAVCPTAVLLVDYCLLKAKQHYLKIISTVFISRSNDDVQITGLV
jgi:hypothetical protein